MPDPDINAAVREILAEELGVHTCEIWDETLLHKQLNMDSLDLVNICLQLEARFNLAGISDEEAERFQTVGDIVRYVVNTE